MRCTLLLCLAALSAFAQAPSYSVTRIAGSPPGRFDGVSALDSLLIRPTSLAQDRNGNIYIADQRGISMVTPAGQLRIATSTVVTMIASDPQGNILIGDNGRITRRFIDGSVTPVANSADFTCISGLTSDRIGNIYTSCVTNGLVRRIAADGSITTVAGTGIPGSNGDGGLAIRAQISPTQLTTDASGALYIFDTISSTIRRVTPDGIIRAVAGGGFATTDGVLALNALLAPVGGLAVDNNGNVYLSEPSAHRVRRFAIGGPITVVAGSTGSPGDSGDGTSAGAARLNEPGGLLTDREGSVVLADTGNHRVRKLSQGIFPTILPVAGAVHFRGDGGRGLDALFNGPSSVAVDATGNVYITDSFNSRVRRVDGVTGLISTIAGTGIWGFSGDSGQATAAQLRLPYSVAVDRQGTLWIADRSNDRIRRVTAAGIITTVAGTGELGTPLLSGLGTNMRLVNPGPVIVDNASNVLFAQVTRVSQLSTSGNVTAVAGGLEPGVSANGVGASLARFTSISGIAQDASGNVYIADEPNHVVYRVTPGGIVQTVAGRQGVAGSSGDGGAASVALLNRPKAVTIDPQGHLLIADQNGRFIRAISDGVIRTVAGKGGVADQFPNGQALSVSFGQITSLTSDAKGVIYFADSELGIVGKLTPLAPAKVSIISGDNQTGLTESQLAMPLVVRVTDADGVPVAGLPVNFWALRGIAFFSNPSPLTNSDGDASVIVTFGTEPGNVQIASSTSGLLPVIFNATANQRAVALPPTRISYSVGTTAGTFLPSDDFAVLRSPDSVTADIEGNVYFSDSSTHRILMRTAEGSVQLFAGTGIRGSSGLNGFADDARLNNPTGVAAGPRSAVYFSDRDNHRVLRVTGDNVLQLVAGTGVSGFNGDGMAATASQLSRPTALTVSAAGEVYIVDSGNGLIRRVQQDGALFNLVENAAEVTALAVDIQDNLYLAEPGRIRKRSRDGELSVLASDLGRVSGLALDAAGNLYFSEESRIRRLLPDGTIEAVSSTGASPSQIAGIALDTRNNLWIASRGDRTIQRLDLTKSEIETAAGKPAPSGDNDQALLALLNVPVGLAVDAATNLYIADSANGRIRRITPDGIISTIAGGTTPLQNPRYVAVDSRGAIYFTDGALIRRLEPGGGITLVLSNTATIGCLYVTASDELVICNGNRIQRLLAGGQLQLIAGAESAGFSGDNGPATSAQLSAPRSVVQDRLGNFYFADSGNLRVRRITPGGVISTFAGTGRRGFTADGRPAADSDLDAPSAVAVDAEGNVYIAETNRIRKVSPTGIIVTIAGVDSFGFAGESGFAIEAQFDGIQAMVIDSSGSLYVSDTQNHRVRKLTPLD